MRIVIFIDWFAPAYKAGGPIQSIVNLVNLPLEGTEYRVVCSNKDLGGKPLAGIPPDQWVRYNGHTQVWYSSNDKKIIGLITELRKWQPDVFFINGIYSLYYNLVPLLVGKARKKIVSARGMLHAGALSQKGFKKRLYLRVWKALKLHRKNFFHATNTEEESFIKTVFGEKTRVHVAANLPRMLHTAGAFPKRENSLELISIGLISPMKNYLPVLRALALCDSQVNYTIYGPVKDAAYWEECKAAMKTLPPNIRVLHPGDLPSAHVPEALGKAHLFVLPSKSENFGHAIYEALTAGVPVVTSHGTPWNGLEVAKAGMNVSPENDYELSKAICSFATADEQELALWRAGAKAYAERAIDIGRIRSQYQRMFQD